MGKKNTTPHIVCSVATNSKNTFFNEKNNIRNIKIWNIITYRIGSRLVQHYYNIKMCRRAERVGVSAQPMLVQAVLNCK